MKVRKTEGSRFFIIHHENKHEILLFFSLTFFSMVLMLMPLEDFNCCVLVRGQQDEFLKETEIRLQSEIVQRCLANASRLSLATETSEASATKADWWTGSVSIVWAHTDTYTERKRTNLVQITPGTMHGFNHTYTVSQCPLPKQLTSRYMRIIIPSQIMITIKLQIRVIKAE